METLRDFIVSVAKAARGYYGTYQILPSLCIAQFILESNKADYKKGELKLSGLAADCHNYAGMKWTSTCGCDYKEYKTGEQRKDGSYYTVTARFRKYPTREAGVKGYFDFLQYKRYQNLRGVTAYQEACRLIREDGWATSIKYTDNLIKIIETLRLDLFDNFSFNPECYMQKETYPVPSVVEIFKSCGIPSSFKERKKIAIVNELVGYSGTAEENVYLMALLIQGKLKRV